MEQEETKDGEKLLSKPYLGDARVGYRSVSSNDLPSGRFRLVKRRPKIGARSQIRTKSNYENWPKSGTRH